MYLSTAAQGRDNNLNLMRFLAAMAVLVSHSYALATGSGETEPLRASLGMTPGTIAVDIFFIVSGFLVTGSLMKSDSAIDFFWGRALRIFPALWVMLLLTVFGLGFAFTTLSKHEYLFSRQPYSYLARCGTLFAGVNYNLPGVFEDNPYKQAVNGSLWTMPYEVRMYAILLGGWLFLKILGMTRGQFFKVLVIVSAIASGAIVLYLHFQGGDKRFGPWLFFMFFTGAAFYILRKWIYLSHTAFWILITALVAAGFVSRNTFTVVYVLTLAYIVFYLAFIPGGVIRKYNQVGDYSYGIYVYAFPLQQAVAALIPGVSVATMFFLSAGATLVMAILSWHLLERNALAHKRYFVDKTRQILALGRTNTNSSLGSETQTNLGLK